MTLSKKNFRAPALAGLSIALGLLLSGCSGGGSESSTNATTANSATVAQNTASTETIDPVSPQTSIETCVVCHGASGSHPVGDIHGASDVHRVDTNADGPLTPSGVRRLDATLTQVDLSGSSVVIDFDVVTEEGVGYDSIDAGDGRFAIVRLDPGMDGDPSEWVGIGDSSTERFTSGVLTSLSGGAYRYVSLYDPAGRVASGETIRIAIQLSGSDIPAENAWCDFDANLTAPNLCGLGTSLTRDIVQTADCNTCHGPTNETKLSFHGGGRTDVEYCVTCHNPPGNTDMPLLVHKIHAGATLTNGFRGYSDVVFTKDLDDCSSCHRGGGADETNWKTAPNQVACGSCHDDVNFATGQNHGSGGVQPDNRYCSGCHPPDGPVTPIQYPVETVHLGGARTTEAARYRGLGNGFDIERLDYDETTGAISVIYSVGMDGSRMNLATAPEWTSGGRLSLRLGWTTDDYENTGSGSTPAQPVALDALDVGGVVTDLGSNRYMAVLIPPSSASDTVTVHLEGRPVADLSGDGSLDDRIPVASVFDNVNVEGGRNTTTEPRREIVDSDLCAACHDSGGAGLAFHGTNRVGEMAVCSVCHNANATDINQRPADPATTPDGKTEEAIDFKRMIHQIHAGEDLTSSLVVYGFGGNPHDYGHVNFIGNLVNCETCHVADSYSTEWARAALPSTVDTGADIADPTDDQNVSSTASVCSSCHDTDRAVSHMLQHGASFRALDEHIR
jgi:OmcA/MtrC family decaheme c-type cytochrome